MEEQVENSERVGFERQGGDWYYHNEQCKIPCCYGSSCTLKVLLFWHLVKHYACFIMSIYYLFVSFSIL